MRVATPPPASLLLQRQRWGAGHGITFEGRRSLNEALGYPEKLTPKDYVAKYERGGVAKRVVEVLPMSTWRGGGELVENEDPSTETDFEKAFVALNTRLKVWPTFLKTDILAGLGDYAGILLGAPGNMDTELTECKPEELLYLQPFMQRDLTMGDLEGDPHSPRFNQPKFYNLAIVNASQQGAKVFDGKVHWSRIIPVVDGALDSEFIGTPRLRAIWNYLEDLEKVVGGGAEAYWKRADRGLHLQLDTELDPTTEQVAEMKADIEEYTHGLKRILTTRGVDINNLGSDVANFNSNEAAIIELICATIGVPQRILMGSERGELASTTDQSNYDDRVQDRRESFAGPNVVRPFVARMQELGVLPPAEFVVRWPEVDELNSAQRMELALTAAKVNQAAGITVIKANEIRDRCLGFAVVPELDAQEEERAQAVLEPSVIEGEIVPAKKALPAAAEGPILHSKFHRLLALKQRKQVW
jgi:hypothetical protein